MVIHLLTLTAVFQAVTQSILREEEGEANPSSFLFIFIFFIYFWIKSLEVIPELIFVMTINLLSCNVNNIPLFQIENSLNSRNCEL